MADFERAVKIIAESYKEDCAEHDCSIRELFKIWGCDKEDLLEEFLYILKENNFDGYYTDDCEIIENSGEVKTLTQLIGAVKKYRFE